MCFLLLSVHRWILIRHNYFELPFKFIYWFLKFVTDWFLILLVACYCWCVSHSLLVECVTCKWMLLKWMSLPSINYCTGHCIPNVCSVAYVSNGHFRGQKDSTLTFCWSTGVWLVIVLVSIWNQHCIVYKCTYQLFWLMWFLLSSTLMLDFWNVFLPWSEQFCKPVKWWVVTWLTV